MLSASADGTVQLWNTFPFLLQQPPPKQTLKRDSRVLSAVRVFRPTTSISSSPSTTTAVPTSVLFLPSDETTFGVGLTNGGVCVINLETGRQIHYYEPMTSKSGITSQSTHFVIALPQAQFCCFLVCISFIVDFEWAVN